jgi:hypothetical protein
MSELALALASEGYFMKSNLIDSDPRFIKMDPFLHQILLDVTGITSLFNTDHTGFKLDASALQELIVSVGCRLVRFHPLSEPQLENRLESAFHIGLTALVTTLFLQFGRRRFLKYGLVTQYLREVIDRGLDGEDNDLMLWLLFLGGISVLKEVDEAWLALRIYQAVRSLNIEDWAGLHSCLIQFPWIKTLHDEPGKALWDSVVKSPLP